MRRFMRIFKIGLGVMLAAAGLGLVFIPDVVVPFLCGHKAVFGLLVAISGGLLLMSRGRGAR